MESCVICADGSDWMRNGDYLPTRLQAQEQAINLICQTKKNKNPENCMALLNMATSSVLITLTREQHKVMMQARKIQPAGKIAFIKALRISHLCLKHRQSKNHKMKIIMFVGSPVSDEEAELVQIAKKLRKEKVYVDIINFGEEENVKKLNLFIETINGKDEETSHLLSIPPESILTNVLRQSHIIGGDGAAMTTGEENFGLGEGMNDDPELAMALSVSMQEERARLQLMQRNNAGDTAGGSQAAGSTSAYNSNQDMNPMIADMDIDNLTEQQQLELAMQISLERPIEADGDLDIIDSEYLDDDDDDDDDDVDAADIMEDVNFMQDVINTLGVSLTAQQILEAAENQEATTNANENNKNNNNNNDEDKGESDDKSADV